MNRKFFSIRKKLIISFLVFFLLIIGTSIYISIAYRISAAFFENLLAENQKLESLSDKLQALLFYTEVYLTRGEQKDFDSFQTHYNQIEKLNQEISREYYDLSQIIKNNLQEALAAVKNKKEKRAGYYQSHTDLSDNISFIQSYITKLINQNNLKGNQLFSQGKKYLKNIERMGILLAILTGLLSLSVLLYFSISITIPLNKIMNNARKISNGNFEVPPIIVSTNDELKSIAMVFNEMAGDIRKLFAELQGKIGLERELQQEKVKNLKINNLLREAELKQLQSQINPHFLYNTLNTIAQVAILEEADQTGNLIKKIATLLRYNLKQGNNFVPLKDEIENIKIYCNIMEFRYANKLSFQLSHPIDIENYDLPSMLIQPLIENAFIHGIKAIENRKGIISINIFKKEKYLMIIVSDNGRGILKEKLERITSSADSSLSGLKNIIERLELYYQRNDLFAITSKPGFYTCVTLKIPLLREEKEIV